MEAKHALASVFGFAEQGEDPRLKVENSLRRGWMKRGLHTTDPQQLAVATKNSSAQRRGVTQFIFQPGAQELLPVDPPLDAAGLRASAVAS